MKTIFYPAALICALSVLSCGNKQADAVIPKYEELAKAKWLLGKWGISSPEGNMVEAWEIKNDSTYAGKTHFIIGTDTVFTETISLEQRGKDVNYVTQMANQNEGKPVAFKMTKANEKQLVFENPTHDFPQKITYTLKGDSLLAEISGMNKGKAAKESFPMGKLK